MNIKVLELGTGTWIRPGLEHAEHHGFVKHSDFISHVHNLNSLPWPWSTDTWDEIYSIDVMQMLDIGILEWMREIYRILRPGGIFIIRLPAPDNPEVWRDPMDKRPYHPDSMFYFDPEHELYQKFSRAYWENIPTFKVRYVDKRANNYVYELRKV
jgi:SAM-dependent methyltransferase